MRTEERLVTGIIVMLVLLGNLLAMNGCSNAKAQEAVTIVPMTGPGGVSCYVFYSGTTPFAGSCR